MLAGSPPREVFGAIAELHQTALRGQAQPPVGTGVPALHISKRRINLLEQVKRSLINDSPPEQRRSGKL